MERSDGELVRESRRGDKEAFRELVERYQRKIVSVALGMVHNRDDALEIAQETFVKAYENLDDFKGESSFYTWLYRIVVNLAIDFQRRERRHPTVSLEDRERLGSGEDIEDTLKEERLGDPYQQTQAREIGDRVQRSDQRVDPRSQSRHTSARSRGALLRRDQSRDAVLQGYGHESAALRAQEAAKEAQRLPLIRLGRLTRLPSRNARCGGVDGRAGDDLS